MQRNERLLWLIVVWAVFGTSPSLTPAMASSAFPVEGDPPEPEGPPEDPDPETPTEQDEENENETEPEKEDAEDGDPVTLFTGNLHLEETDLSIRGRAIDLDFKRTYHNGTATHSYLGLKWDLNWFQRVVIQYAPFVALYRGPGDTVGPALSTGGGFGDVTQFPIGGGGSFGGEGGHHGGHGGGDGVGWVVDGFSPLYAVAGIYYYDGKNGIDKLTQGDSVQEWQRPAGHFDQFLALGDNPSETGFYPSAFYMRSPDGMVYAFEQTDIHSPLIDGVATTFWLTSVSDRHGNTVTLEYESVGAGATEHFRPARLIDEFGRDISFTYQNGRLIEITDFTGRTVNYGYDEGRLSEVTSPEIPGSFPNGRTIRYEYGSMDSATNFCIEKIFDPRSIAANPSNPVPYLVNTYDPAGDRVIAQQMGGIDGEGIVAGGRYVFLSSLQEDAVDWGWFQEGGRVLVISPGGNVTATVFDEDGFDILTYQFTGRLDPEDPAFADPTTVNMNDLVQLSLNTMAEATDPSLNSLSPDPLYASAYTLPLRPSDPPSYVVRRAFAASGLMIEEERAGQLTTFHYNSDSPDRFQQGNLLKIERAPVPDDGSRIITGFAYEPLFNQQRAYLDPRAMDMSYLPPNAGPWSMGRYMTKTTFDYQEGDIVTAWQPMVDLWDIDLAQDSMYAALPGLEAELPRILDDASLGELNGDGSTVQAVGDAIMFQRPTAMVFEPDTIGSAQASFVPQEAIELLTYDLYGQLTSRTDARGFVTEFRHYPESDPFGVGGADPVFEGGGLLGETRLPEGVVETARLDELGRMVEKIDGRGAVTAMEYNEVDELVAVTDSEGNTISFVFDANGNTLESHVEHVIPLMDPGTGFPTGQHQLIETLVTRYQYDLLDRLIEVEAPIEGVIHAITRHRYDREGNLALTMQPEWDSNPNDLESRVFDERGLLLSATRGGLTDQFQGLATNSGVMADPHVATIPSGELITESYAYNSAGRRVEVEDAEGFRWVSEYDAFQRLIRETTPMGDETVTVVDLLDQVLEVLSYDGAESTGTLLSHRRSMFDEQNREFQTDRALFAHGADVPVMDGALSPDDGWVTTRSIYDENRNLIMHVDDNRRFEGSEFDGLGRLVREWDGSCQWLPAQAWTTPGSSQTEYFHDASSNVLQRRRTEWREDGSSEIYSSWRFWDSLGRLTARVNDLGHTARYAYDSRGNRVFQSDARTEDLSTSYLASLDGYDDHLALANPAPTMAINDHGNVIHHEYDGLSRKTSTTRWMKSGGQGDGSLQPIVFGDALLTTAVEYDRNGRVTARIDDKGSRTEYEFDALGRPMSFKNADGIENEIVSYDKRGLVKVAEDGVGTRVTSDYDDSGRLLSRTIELGPGVAGTTWESYQYDGLDRVRVASDNDSTVARAYDSLGRIIEETQNGQVIEMLYDGTGHLSFYQSPGGRIIQQVHDPLNRLREVVDFAASLVIARNHYLGGWKIERQELIPFLQSSFMERVSDFDALGRIESTLSTRVSDGHSLNSWTLQWDRAGNKTERRNNLTSVENRYSYDSIQQMVGSTRLNSPSDRSVSYLLDGGGNRFSVSVDGVAELYAANPVNEYDAISSGALEHDDNGNLATLGGSFTYDYQNRMVGYLESRSTNATYRYDVFGRRIAKEVNGVETRYFYLGWKMVEEQDSSNGTIATYVYGDGPDELLTLNADRDGDGFQEGYVYHSDDMGNVTTLTDPYGTVVETYEYDDYGQPLRGDTLQPLHDESEVHNSRLFAGRPYDWETGLYNFRNRYLSPELGRFTTRDPIGIWKDAANLGNGYTYVGNNPWSYADPFGTEKEKEETPEERRERLKKELKEELDELKRKRDAGEISEKEYRRLRDLAQATLGLLRDAGNAYLKDAGQAKAFHEFVEQTLAGIQKLAEVAVQIHKVEQELDAMKEWELLADTGMVEGPDPEDIEKLKEEFADLDVVFHETVSYINAWLTAVESFSGDFAYLEQLQLDLAHREQTWQKASIIAVFAKFVGQTVLTGVGVYFVIPDKILTLVGADPIFTPAFAEAQDRLNRRLPGWNFGAIYQWGMDFTSLTKDVKKLQDFSDNPLAQPK